MAQYPILVPNGTGLEVRGNVNKALETLATGYAGATQPSPIYPYMWWIDTQNDLVKQATADASQFIVKGRLLTDGTIRWNAERVGRNLIINGDMVVDQRNNGAAQNGVATGYTVDRWSYYGSASGKINAQQNAGAITPPAGFSHYAGLTVANSYAAVSSEIFTYSQRIEGFNCRELSWGTANAKAVTLSFWVRSSLTGLFSGALCNSAQNRSYPFSFSIAQPNTWTFIVVTIPGDTTGTWLVTNGAGVQLCFNLGTGSTGLGTAGAWVGSTKFGVTGSVNVVSSAEATFYITGVQLEPGELATSFEYLQYGSQLALCQRYFCCSINDVDASRYYGYAVSGCPQESSKITFPMTMRTQPTLTLTHRAALNFPAAAGSGSGSLACFVEVRTASSTGNAYFVTGWTANAEL